MHPIEKRTHSTKKFNTNDSLKIVRFGLVFFINGISTFVGYLMPKLPIFNNNSEIIKSIAGRNKWIHTFPKSIKPKVNFVITV